MRPFFKSLINVLSFPLLYPSSYLVVRIFSSYRFGVIFSENIGHMVFDTEAALLRLSGLRCDGRLIRVRLATQEVICNRYILELISKAHFPGLEVRIISNRLFYYFCRFLQRYSVSRRLLLQTYGLTTELGGTVVCSPVHYSVPKQDKAAFAAWLKEKKPEINTDKRCIILHNRDSTYRFKADHNSYRDFSPGLFHSIIKKYGQDYTFLRVGRVAKEPIPFGLNACIDLPFSGSDDKLDVLCHDASLFYFGSDSGVQSISLAFRKPVAGVCFSPNSFGFIRQCSAVRLGFIPKKLLSLRSGQLIGLVEMYERGWINFFKTSEFKEANVQVMDNSEAEVLEFFSEALAMYESDFDKKSIYTPEQEEFWRIVTHYEPESKGNKLITDNCFIGAGFLKRNTYLIEH